MIVISFQITWQWWCEGGPFLCISCKVTSSSRERELGFRGRKPQFRFPIIVFPLSKQLEDKDEFFKKK